MTITEESRHRLYQRLEELLGPDEAATLMEHLPPVGWADIATKRDIDHLGAMSRSELEAGLHALRAEFSRDLRSQMLAMLAANTTLAALVVAAIRLV